MEDNNKLLPECVGCDNLVDDKGTELCSNHDGKNEKCPFKIDWNKMDQELLEEVSVLSSKKPRQKKETKIPEIDFSAFR